MARNSLRTFGRAGSAFPKPRLKLVAVDRDADQSLPVARVARPLGPRADLARRALTIFAAVTGIAYLTWRALYTIDPQHLGFGVGLLSIETLLYLNAALFWWVGWGEVRRAPFALVPGLTVDVFVTTYNEP